MNNIMYKIIDGLLSALARLPLGVLYVISDVILYPLMRYVLRYRLNLIQLTMPKALPGLAYTQRKRVIKKFYHHFCDYIVETIKLLHISDEEMMKRMSFKNLEVVTDALEQGRSVTLYFAHVFNWEWATSVTLHMKGEYGGREVCFGQVYRPLKNKCMDRLMLKVRSRFGSESWPKSTVFRHLIQKKNEGVLTLTGFMSDQKPSHGDKTHVVRFLHRPTALITGTEQQCRKLDTVPVYWDMYCLGRGYYQITCRPLPLPSESESYEITDSYARMLQHTIRRDPSLWLWTHNRWKKPVRYVYGK